MDSDNELLSQEEVDALFKQATGKSITAPQPSAAAAAEKPASAPEKPAPAPAVRMAARAPMPERPPAPAPSAKASVPSNGGAPSGNGHISPEVERLLAQIDERLTGLEDRLDRIEEAARHRGSGVDRDTAAKLTRLSAETRRLKSEMQTVKTGLEHTPDYRLGLEFTCESCGAHGTVATLHRCTSCGRQGWFGWWPAEPPR